MVSDENDKEKEINDQLCPKCDAVMKINEDGELECPDCGFIEDG